MTDGGVVVVRGQGVWVQRVLQSARVLGSRCRLGDGKLEGRVRKASQDKTSRGRWWTVFCSMRLLFTIAIRASKMHMMQ